MQTSVENQYLKEYKEERVLKQATDMAKWRTQICNISWAAEKKLDQLQKRENKLLETMRQKDVNDGKRKMTNRYMLDAMQIESRRWPKLDDLEGSIQTNIILPQTILNYSEYQDKLQRLAFYAEQGDNEAMQKILDKEHVISRKNSFLQPLYRDLKSTIKHMTYTEEFKLLR